jgi:DNA polymerase III epsilon subunit-like protein
MLSELHMSYINQNTINKLINKRVLFLKVETTGLPEQQENMEKPEKIYYPYNYTNKYDASRLIQIGWSYVNKMTKDFDSSEYDIKEIIRKPFNFEISKESTTIHGLTIADTMNGITLNKIMNGEFGKRLLECDYIVSHNAFFDVSILASELYRIKFNKTLNKLQNLIQTNKIICIGQLARIHVAPEDWEPKYNYQIPRQHIAYHWCYDEYPPYVKKHMAAYKVSTTVMIFEHIIQNS